MKILFAGKRNLDYNRVDILYSGLEQLDTVSVSKYQLHKKNKTDGAALALAAQGVDFIYIPPFRPTDVKFIKKYCPAIPIVFDPLISDFMSKLYDHKQWWKSPFKYVRDYSAFHNSDILLTDTEIHRQYFSKTFFIPKEKLHTLHIGTQIPEKTATKTKDSNTFNVGFYGRYQPLQGASEIVKAAALLQNEPDISFTMIGNYRVTSAYPLAQKLRLKNINFILEQPTAELFDSISSFDACLGVFGRSMKADAVIPNKIYHYAGFGKAIITRETPGVKELFEHKKNIHLCEGSPESIATAILDLKKDHSYSENIGANARVLMEEQYSPIHVAERFVQLLKSTIS